MILFSRIKNSLFLKNASVIMTGTMIAQGISIITAPLITRLYSPNDYGILGLVMMLSGVLGIICTFQYQNSIIVEKENSVVSAIFSLCLFLSIAVSILILLIILFFHKSIALFFDSKELSTWLFYIPISILFSGVNNTLMVLANKLGLYKRMSFNRISAAFIAPAISISSAFLLPKPTGLFLGLLGGQIFPTIFLFKDVVEKYQIKITTTLGSLVYAAKRHAAFPKFSLPGEFFNILIAQIPVFILGKFYSTSSVGQFNLSNRLLNIPTQAAAQGVGEVFRSRATEIFHQRGRCDKLFIKTFLSLTALAIVPFSAIFFFGPDLFSLFLGKNWSEAGKFAAYLTPMFFLRFIISPLTFVCYIVGKNHVSLIGSIIAAATSIVIGWIAVKFNLNTYQLLGVYVTNFCVIYTFMFLINYRFSKGGNEI